MARVTRDSYRRLHENSFALQFLQRAENLSSFFLMAAMAFSHSQRYSRWHRVGVKLVLQTQRHQVRVLAKIAAVACIYAEDRTPRSRAAQWLP